MITHTIVPAQLISATATGARDFNLEGALVGAGIAALFCLGVFALMWRSWRRRTSKQLGQFVPYPIPEGFVAEQTESLSYVATTLASKPLERVTARAVAFRGKAQLGVSKQGIMLEVVGEAPFFIPSETIDEVQFASWTIDRVVEKHGLLVVRWNWAETAVDSYFRPEDAEQSLRLQESIGTLSKGNEAHHVK